MEAGSGVAAAAVPDAAEQKKKELSLFESQGVKVLPTQAVESSNNQPYRGFSGRISPACDC